MPASFRFPAPYWSAGDLWLLRGATHPSWPDLRDPTMLAFGLIAAGAPLARAQQEADATAAALDARYPKSGAIGLRLLPYAETVRADSRPRLLLILGASGVVLLIVCVNIVNLLLGRSVDRHRELAARACPWRRPGAAGAAADHRNPDPVLARRRGGCDARDVGITRDRRDQVVQYSRAWKRPQ
jgi:hypothetical protein